MRLPDFFIAGAPKCGTTSLAAWLRGHPQLYLSPLKEPHFFNTDQRYRKCRTWRAYRRQFAPAGPAHRAVGEASVWYLHSRVAVPRILDAQPAARFVVCLRNPAAMAHSLHAHLLHGGREHVADFAAAWQAAPARRRGAGLCARAGEPTHLVYPDACALGTQLQRLYALVPRERVLTVLLDDLAADPRAQYLRVLAFLGADDDGRADFSAHNTARRRVPGAAATLLRGYLSARAVLRIPPLRTGLVRRLDRASTASAPPAPLDAPLWAALGEHFQPEVARLEALLGRDLSHWLGPARAPARVAHASA